MSARTAYLLERTWVDDVVQDDVLVEVEDGRFASVTPGGSGGHATRLPGLTIPGLANCHSHAFHRALRGRTQRGRGTFWTWRDQMYDVAARLFAVVIEIPFQHHRSWNALRAAVRRRWGWLELEPVD